MKVDLGLVQRSSPGAPSSAVVESIVAFATRTGALVIGEGVEHEEQVEQLTGLGVTAAQGYLFSRPGPLPDWSAEPRLVDLLPRHAEVEPLPVDSRPRGLEAVDRARLSRRLAAPQASSARSIRSASSTRPGSSPGRSPAGSHTIRRSRPNQVLCRLAYCRVRRAVMATASSSDHSPAR